MPRERRRLPRESCRQHQQADAHDGQATEQHFAAPCPVEQQESATTVIVTLTTPMPAVREDGRRVRGEAGLLEDVWRIVDHRIDAGDLLEDREPDADDERRPGVWRSEQGAKRHLALLGTDVALQTRHLGIDGRRAAQRPQRVARLLPTPLCHQPARALRQHCHAEAEKHAGHRPETEHPAPRARDVGHREVDEIGGQDAARDTKLVQRHDHAALVRRRCFRKIERRQHRMRRRSRRQGPAARQSASRVRSRRRS